MHQVGLAEVTRRRRRPGARTGLLAEGHEGEGAGEGRQAEDGGQTAATLDRAWDAYRDKACAGVPWLKSRDGKHRDLNFPGFPLVVRR